MLPVEVLVNIARCIPRGYLDGMLTCNRAITDGISAASEPHDQRIALRRRALLEVLPCDNGSLKIRLTAYARDAAHDAGVAHYTGTRVDCYNAEQLRGAMHNTWVADMSLSTMDPDLHNTLMPFAPRWQGQTTLHEHGVHYANKDTFLRVFEELVDGVGLITLNFTGPMPFNVEPFHFWNLAAIRNSDILRVDNLPFASPVMGLSSYHILRWVRIPPREMALKRLEIRQDVLAQSVEELLQDLQQDFLTVCEERPPVTFKITIILRYRFTGRAILTNKTMHEVLRFYRDPSYEDALIIRRYSP